VNYGPVCQQLIYQKLSPKGKSVGCQTTVGRIKSEVNTELAGVKRCLRNSL
jgi:hypothetical protein